MRISRVSRKTNETNISVEINLDGTGETDISTGVGFFNHMMDLFAVHGQFDLRITCEGDLNVDCHHSIEDMGICLGSAVKNALDSKSKINRYGTFFLPMDESLAFVSLDLSNRPFLVFDATFAPAVGNFDTEMVEEFLRAFAFNAGITLHAKVLYGKNTHHKIEAIFKALGHALKIAVSYNENVEILSTKGIL